jgi:SNF2 family DNA or RNA helicase
MGEIMDIFRGAAFSLSNNTIDLEGDNLIVKFKWDADYYGRALSIPGAHYDKEKKQFEIPKGYLRRVVQNFARFTKSPEVFNEISKQRIEEKEHKELVKELFKEVDFTKAINGRVPMKHQVQAAEFILKNRKSILADDMGCGKTLSSLLAMSLTGLPIYVIAPKTLHDNWFKEANMLDIKIEGIYSWGSLKTFPKGEFCVIADVAHYAQNISSKRTKAFLKFVSNAKFLVCVTGTPIANSNPKNAYPLLTAIDDPLSYNKRIFEEYYCNLRASNHHLRLKEFYENTKHIILRRRIEDCVDLPEKTRVLRAAELTPLAAKTYEEVYNGLRNSYLSRLSKGLIVDINEKMMMFMQLRHAASFAKIGETVKIAKEIYAQDHATVFFVSFVDVAELLKKELEKIGPCGILHGKVNIVARNRAIDDFQAGRTKFIICTYGTGGVGVNLFAGNHVVLVDRPWTPKDTSQAEARVYRYGQTKKVLSIWIQCNKTDQRIDSLILQKSRKISTMLNGNAELEEIEFDIKEEIDRLFDEIFDV